jgi:hypothetical protein
MLFFLASRAFASGEGTTDGQILLLGAGARAAAMAGTQAALADDVNAAYWNPAGLGLLKSAEVSGSYNRWVQDVANQYAAAAWPTRRLGTFAVSMQRMSIENFYGSDANGALTGELSNGSQATGVAWGKNLLSGSAAPGGGLFVGLSASAFRETVTGLSAAGRSYDGGILWRPSGTEDGPSWLRRVALGAAVRHLGQAAAFDGSAAKMPTEEVVGAAYSHFLSGDIVNLGADYHQTASEKPYFTAGAEYWLKTFLALRAGYRSGAANSQGSWRAGVGFRIKPIEVDYAWSPMGQDLGSGQQVSVAWRFGPPERTLSPGIADDLYDYHMVQGQAHMNLQMYDRAVLDFNDALRIRPQDDKAMKLLLQCGEAMK